MTRISVDKHFEKKEVCAYANAIINCSFNCLKADSRAVEQNKR